MTFVLRLILKREKVKIDEKKVKLEGNQMRKEAWVVKRKEQKLKKSLIHFWEAFQNQTYTFASTALFGKVYRTILQSKRRRVKTGVIMYIQNDTSKNYLKIFLNFYLHIFIFVIKLKHDMIFF